MAVVHGSGEFTDRLLCCKDLYLHIGEPVSKREIFVVIFLVKSVSVYLVSHEDIAFKTEKSMISIDSRSELSILQSFVSNDSTIGHKLLF